MNPIVLIICVLYILVFAIEVKQWNTCPDRRAEIIGWSVLALHVLVYTAAYVYLSFSTGVTTILFNVWSTALRLHGAITLLSVSWARYRRQEHRNGC